MEKAILVTTVFADEKNNSWSPEELSTELMQLSLSSGAAVIEQVICHRDKPTPNYFIGQGKAQEIGQMRIEKGADAVIFNNELSSTQQRNLEDIIGVKIIDRTQLILDIFARRAKSNEGKVQVELAQLLYFMPRLTGKGILLSRLGGGIGTRGPGEKKLEVDRRRIRDRIHRLEIDLEKLKKRRQSMRIARQRKAIPTIAIIGYTNCGKSTLLNSLTGSKSIVSHRLFSTLDPTARKFKLPNNQKVIFIDTVGFINNLPHHLIEAFKATLEEVRGADLLLHLIDVTHPKAHERKTAVYRVLRDLEADKKPIVTALNKIDILDNENILNRTQRDTEGAVSISALRKFGFGILLGKIMNSLSQEMARISLDIPQDKMDLLNLIYQEGRVLKREYRNGAIYIEAEVPKRLKSQILPRRQAGTNSKDQND